MTSATIAPVLVTSPGHIGWSVSEYGTFEYFVRDEQVMRAPASNAFDLAGYRLARWECSVEHWNRYPHLAQMAGLVAVEPAAKPEPTAAERYTAWLAADQAFHAALVADFGKRNAGDIRYQPSKWTDAVQAAWKSVEIARAHYIAAGGLPSLSADAKANALQVLA